MKATVLTESSYIFSPKSIDSADVYRHVSGRCHTLPFFLTYFCLLIYNYHGRTNPYVDWSLWLNFYGAVVGMLTLWNTSGETEVAGMQLQDCEWDVGNAETEHAEHEALALQISEFGHQQVHNQRDEKEHSWYEHTCRIHDITVIRFTSGVSVVFKTHNGDVLHRYRSILMKCASHTEPVTVSPKWVLSSY